MRAALYVCMVAIIGLGIFQRPLVESAAKAAKIFQLN